MAKRLVILTDYKGHFGNKRFSKPYRSGMDLDLLRGFFEQRGFVVETLPLCDLDFRRMDLKDQLVLYTSSEDGHSLYKSYIEDICYGLELQGASLIPSFRFLRAHNNKVFMEILRSQIRHSAMWNLEACCYGCLEELEMRKDRYFGKAVVLKSAEGAKSRNVRLARDPVDAMRKASWLSASRNLIEDARDIVRSLRNRGYSRESTHRRKFITQSFVPDLKNDWKLLVFGRRIYALRRETRQNDFRASGSGMFDFAKEEIDPRMLDFASEIRERLNVPHLALDVGFDGEKIFLFEFQAVYFGSYTLERSPFYYAKEGGSWRVVMVESIYEEVYADSIIEFIESSKEAIG